MSIQSNQLAIAAGEETHREARIRIRASFNEPRQRYVDNLNALVAEVESLGNLKVALDHHQANMKGVEAGWTINGEFEGLKNDKEREAAKESLRRSDPAYVPLAAAAYNVRQQIASVEANVERLKLEIRLSRYDMEVAIAELNAMAGEERER